jgi:hypothetical protein
MSTVALTTTTLSAAITAAQSSIGLASTTGATGGSTTTPPTVLVVAGEAMLVLGVPLSGTVEVMRGYEGTKAKPHASGALVQYGARNRYSFKEGGTIGLDGTGGTPDGALPTYQLPLGTRKVENGKEYIMCDFTATVHSGVTVSISNDGLFTAAPLTTTHQGAVGVVAEQTSSSDTWGWVQIYGTASAQEAGGTSAATSAYVPIVAGSVSSPDAGMAALIGTTSTPQRLIYGMFITGAATTNVTSAASHTGVAVPVFLNYPYVYQAATDVGLS